MLSQRKKYLSLALAILFVFGGLTTTLAEAADPENGKKLFTQFCASCHGTSGKGDGPAAAALNPKPRDFTDKALMSQKTDERLFSVIKNGGAANGLSPLMAPWGSVLKDDQIRDVIAYIRTLAQ